MVDASSWLPGFSAFGEHTWVFWTSLLVGTGLGLLLTRLRAPGTRLEGKWWIYALGGLAGAVLGVVIFLCVAFFAALLVLSGGQGGTVNVFALTLLGMLAVFALFVMRGRYGR